MSHRTTVVVLASVVLIVVGNGTGLGTDSDSPSPEAVSALEIAVVQSAGGIQESDAGFFRPSDPAATPVSRDGARIEGVLATTIAAKDEGLTVRGALIRMTGTDLEFLTRSGFGIRNGGIESYYNTRPHATVYLARFTDRPVAADDGVVGVSLAWRWPGETGLISSQFPSDPLLGYTHSSEHGSVAGENFSTLSSVEEGSWTQYANPLLTFDGPGGSGDDAFYVGWVVPGIPDAAAVTLSYADDPTDPASLTSQQVAVDGVTGQVAVDALVVDLDELQEEELALLREWWLLSAGFQSTSETELDEQNEPDPDPTPSGFSSAVAIWIGLGLLVLIAGVLGWYQGWWSRGSAFGISPLDPHRARSMVDTWKKSGRELLGGEWIAPTRGDWAESAGVEPDGPTNEWVGVFVNVETLESVGESDAGYEELVERFSMRPRPIGTDDEVVIS